MERTATPLVKKIKQGPTSTVSVPPIQNQQLNLATIDQNVDFLDFVPIPNNVNDFEKEINDKENNKTELDEIEQTVQNLTNML